MVTAVKLNLKLEKLIPPQPVPTRARPFPLSSVGDLLVYPHGKVVYLRNLQDGSCREYREHTQPVEVAKLSPNGLWIASGDSMGNLRIWSAENLKVKYEGRVLTGSIMDISWDPEGQHVIAVGDGKEKFGHALLVESGSNCGEIAGPTKRANAVAIKPTRPYRSVIVSDDCSTTLLTGTPYKFIKTLKDHQKFVQTVKYSPQGDKFVTGGADGRVFVYEGNEGTLIKELKEKESFAHGAGVLALEFLDNDTLFTGSSDGSIKLWNLNASEVLLSLPSNQQRVGLTLNQKHNSLFILNLDSSIEQFNLQDRKVKNVINGHVKGITSLAVIDGSVVSATYDGQLIKWSDGCISKTNLPLAKLHKQNKSLLAINNNGAVLNGNLEGISELSLKDASIVDSFVDDVEGSLYLLPAGKKCIIKNGKCIELPGLTGEPVVGCSLAKGLIVIGDSRKNLNVYKVDEGGVCSLGGVEAAMLGEITALTSNGSVLAVSDDQRRIRLFKLSTNDNQNVNQLDPIKVNWCHHSAKITQLTWSPSGTLLASAGIDTDILIWNPESPVAPVSILKGAHASPVTALKFLEEGRVVSGGGDASIRTWSLQPQ